MDKEKYKYKKAFYPIKNKEKEIFITTHLLNMRSGAGYSAPVITVIPKNTEVTYEGRKINDWYFVKYKDYEGFCLKAYLK